MVQVNLTAEQSYSTPYVNTTLFLPLLMSLFTQKNAPDTSQGFKEEYDYIIVGGGSAGSTLASRLSEEKCVSVLLLEAGKNPPIINDIPALARSFWFSDLDWQYKTVPQKHSAKGLMNRQVIWPSGKAVGGSSIINAMLYVRGNPKNYDDWADMGAEGWGYDDVLPYFKKAEDNRDPAFATDGYHGVGGPLTVETAQYHSVIRDPLLKATSSFGFELKDTNAANQTGTFNIQGTFRNQQRCSTAKAYLVPAENRENLDILPGAHVRKIIIENGRATGVQFDFNGQTSVVRAKREVIVTSGTTNTAQLLMLSGVGPKEHLEELKIPVVADLPVGKYFQDHPATAAFYVNTGGAPGVESLLTNPANVQEYIQNRTGPLTSPELISLGTWWKTNTDPSDFPSLALFYGEVTSTNIKKNFGLIPEYYHQKFGPYEGKPLVACFIAANQPKSIGSVQLNSNDPYDPPLIDPNYLEDTDDVKTLIEGIKACDQVFLSEPMKDLGVRRVDTRLPGCEDGDIESDSHRECHLRTFSVSLSHQVGTAKMGNPNDATTVVDPLLRVKGIKGLRVADASVMPRIPSGNTNVPTIMVAEKAADIIKQDIQCPK